MYIPPDLNSCNYSFAGWAIQWHFYVPGTHSCFDMLNILSGMCLEHFWSVYGWCLEICKSMFECVWTLYTMHINCNWKEGACKTHEICLKVFQWEYSEVGKSFSGEFSEDGRNIWKVIESWHKYFYAKPLLDQKLFWHFFWHKIFGTNVILNLTFLNQNF